MTLLRWGVLLCIWGRAGGPGRSGHFSAAQRGGEGHGRAPRLSSGWGWPRSCSSRERSTGAAGLALVSAQGCCPSARHHRLPGSRCTDVEGVCPSRVLGITAIPFETPARPPSTPGWPGSHFLPVLLRKSQEDLTPSTADAVMLPVVVTQGGGRRSRQPLERLGFLRGFRV